MTRADYIIIGACGLLGQLFLMSQVIDASTYSGIVSGKLEAISVLFSVLKWDPSISLLLISGFGFFAVNAGRETYDPGLPSEKSGEDSDIDGKGPSLSDLKAIQDNIPIGLFRTSVEGAIISANRKFVEMLGIGDSRNFSDISAIDFYCNPNDRARLISILKEKGEVNGFEACLKGCHGRTLWVLMNTRAIPDENNEVAFLDGSIMDITERKTAREELSRSEANLSAVLENTSNAIASFDRDGQIIVYNRVFSDIVRSAFGIETSVGYPILENLPADVSRKYRQYLERCLNGEQFTVENMLKFPDGKTHFYEQSFSPILQDGIITGIALIGYDITDQRESIETLTQFRTALDNSGDAVFIADVSTMKFMDANKTACESLGYTREELLTMGPGDINPELQTDEFKKSMDLLHLRENKRGTVRTVHRTKAGSIFPVEVNIALAENDKRSFYIAAARDISERIKTEEDIRERDENYRLLFENANEGICIIQDGIMKVFNPKMVEMLGYAPEEIPRLTFDKFIHKDDLPFVMDRYKRRLDGEEIPESYDFRAMGKDGETRWINIHAVRFMYMDRPATLCLLTDINESRLAQMALQESEELFRTLVEKMGEGVGIVDPDDNFVFANPAAHDLFGTEAGKLIGRSLREFVSRDSFDTVRRQNSIRKAGKESTYEMEIVRNDGECKNIIVTATPMFNVDGGEIKGVLGVFRDVTRIKKMEEELTRAEKLDSIGILAGGIAHDFNNILTAIMGNISLSKMDVGSEKEVYRRLSDAENAAVRAQDLTMQLLTFSKGGAPIKKAASIIEIVRDSAGFVLRGSNVRAEFIFPENLPAAVVDSGQISQVINNLVINADQAMPNGGVIMISVEESMIDSDMNLPVSPGLYLKLTIKDEGIGIKKDQLPRIFDPYFTTKSAGSGLGLATTYSIIKRHDGHIEVESEPGRGTSFIIYLPASMESPSDRSESDCPEYSGDGRILVMDDERSILNVTTVALEKLGFRVDAVPDGQTAVDHYRRAFEENDPFAAVIMDLTVPGGMGGAKALELIKEIDPNICAIVTSGYSTDPVMANYRSYGFLGYIVKPFKVQDLTGALKQVLCRDTGGR